MTRHAEEAKMQHPALWKKLDILCHGIKDDCEGKLIEKLYVQQNPLFTPRTGNNGLQIKMRMGGKRQIPLNVAVGKQFCARSPYIIKEGADSAHGMYYLHNEIDGSDTPIFCPGSAPCWYMKASLAPCIGKKSSEDSTDSCFIVGKLIVLEGDCTAIVSVTDGCRYFTTAGDACRFCALGGKHFGDINYTETLLNSFAIVAPDDNIENFHLTGGNEYSPDRGAQRYIPVVEQIKRYRSDAKIAVEFSPPAPECQKELFNKLKDAGADSVTMNIEFWNDKIRKEYMPIKGAIPKDDYFTAFRNGIEIFGEGKVTCGFIVGLEPLAETLAGIKRVTEEKVIAEVYPYKPNDGSEMAEKDPYQITETDVIWEASVYANECMTKEHIHPDLCSGCVKCGACGVTQELHAPEAYFGK